MTTSPNSPLLLVRFGEKVLRVKDHLEALEDAAQRFTEEQSEIPSVGEVNSQGTKLLLKLGADFDAPLKWGVIIGDAIHCLRSALDQLATSLWTDAPTNAAAFPICRTAKEWAVEAPRMIWSIPPEYVAVINRAQPYHRGDAAHSHPLAVLHALWNLDKHRAIPAVGLNAAELSVEIVELQGVTLGKFRINAGVALKKHAVIAEASITPDDSGLDPKVNVKPRLGVRPGFGQIEKASAISGKPVTETFHEFLIPALQNVMRDVRAVQKGLPLSEAW